MNRQNIEKICHHYAYFQFEKENAELKRASDLLKEAWRVFRKQPEEIKPKSKIFACIKAHSRDCSVTKARDALRVSESGYAIYERIPE